MTKTCHKPFGKGLHFLFVLRFFFGFGFVFVFVFVADDDDDDDSTLDERRGADEFEQADDGLLLFLPEFLFFCCF